VPRLSVRRRKWTRGGESATAAQAARPPPMPECLHAVSPTLPRRNDAPYLLRMLASLHGSMARSPLLCAGATIVNVRPGRHWVFAEARRLYSGGSSSSSSSSSSIGGGGGGAATFSFVERAARATPLPHPTGGVWRDTTADDVRQTHDAIGVLDVVRTGICARGKSRYFMLVEDDVELCENAGPHIALALTKTAARFGGDDGWAGIRVSQGLIGIILQCRDVPAFLTVLRTRILDGPIDYVLADFWTRANADGAMYFGARRFVTYRYNLFRHIGHVSSFAGRDEAHSTGRIYHRCYDTLSTLLHPEEMFDGRCWHDDLSPCPASIDDDARLARDNIDDLPERGGEMVVPVMKRTEAWWDRLWSERASRLARAQYAALNRNASAWHDLDAPQTRAQTQTHTNKNVSRAAIAESVGSGATAPGNQSAVVQSRQQQPQQQQQQQHTSVRSRAPKRAPPPPPPPLPVHTTLSPAARRAWAQRVNAAATLITPFVASVAAPLRLLPFADVEYVTGFGKSCTEICRERGNATCAAYVLPHLNRCDILDRLVGCPNGCFIARGQDRWYPGISVAKRRDPEPRHEFAAPNVARLYDPRGGRSPLNDHNAAPPVIPMQFTDAAGRGVSTSHYHRFNQGGDDSSPPGQAPSVASVPMPTVPPGFGQIDPHLCEIAPIRKMIDCDGTSPFLIYPTDGSYVRLCPCV
jgi:hypothetical protein